MDCPAAGGPDCPAALASCIKRQRGPGENGHRVLKPPPAGRTAGQTAAQAAEQEEELEAEMAVVQEEGAPVTRASLDKARGLERGRAFRRGAAARRARAPVHA
jgi:hypothetical protein